MPLNAGTVNGSGVGSGLAKEAFDIHLAKMPSEISAEAKQGIADLCTSFAEAFINHFTTNAVITTQVSAGGLQTYTPPSSSPLPTTAPLTPVNLTGTLT